MLQTFDMWVKSGARKKILEIHNSIRQQSFCSLKLFLSSFLDNRMDFLCYLCWAIISLHELFIMTLGVSLKWDLWKFLK